MLQISENVTLLVGVEKNGTRHRQVTIDEMTGFDEEVLSNPKYKATPARALTAMLQRVVQQVAGVTEPKASPQKLLDAGLIRGMYQADRDMLLVAVRLLSFGEDMLVQWRCSSCDEHNEDTVKLTELEVKPWDPDRDPFIEFELPKGIMVDGKLRRNGKLRLPTGVDSEPLSQLSRTDPGGAASAMLASLISGIDGVRLDRHNMQMMKSSDRAYLGEVFREELPGVRLESNLSCPACGALNAHHALDMSSFFARTSTK